MQLSSPAFDHQGTIPSKYTCDGSNISPPLAISGVPSEARSLVLLVDDPDAPGGTFVHWVVYDIPPDVKVIHENTDPGTLGTNNFRKTSYGGPCPPSGTHRYFFKIYALDRDLKLSPGQSKQQVEREMSGHIIAQTELIGLYERV
ncbi:MAG: YbhB/YbcL family Raf kinase inhibitor-like protein [Desulfobulbaceae bacterium]|nr:YbhB/YbcL family Raf kinase inhibitor-like protein [Desulfobulbaceae bacterium]